MFGRLHNSSWILRIAIEFLLDGGKGAILRKVSSNLNAGIETSSPNWSSFVNETDDNAANVYQLPV